MADFLLLSAIGRFVGVSGRCTRGNDGIARTLFDIGRRKSSKLAEKALAGSSAKLMAIALIFADLKKQWESLIGSSVR